MFETCSATTFNSIITEANKRKITAITLVVRGRRVRSNIVQILENCSTVTKINVICDSYDKINGLDVMKTEQNVISVEEIREFFFSEPLYRQEETLKVDSHDISRIDMFRQSLALRGIGAVRHLVPKRFKSSAVGLGIQIWVSGARRLTRKTLRCTLAAKEINIHATCFHTKDHHGESIFWRHDLSLFKRILAEDNANAHKQAVFVEAGPRHYFAAAIIDSGIELMGFCTGLYRRYPKKYQHHLDKGFFIAGDTNTNYEGASIYSPACLAIGAGKKETWSNINF